MSVTPHPHTLRTPGQLIIISRDRTGDVVGDPELPFRIYFGPDDAPKSEAPEVAHLLIRNATGVPITVAFVQKFPPGAPHSDTPLEPTTPISLVPGATDALRVRLKREYQTWLTALRPDYRRHRITYYLHVALLVTGGNPKADSIYDDIDPELIVEGRP